MGVSVRGRTKLTSSLPYVRKHLKPLYVRIKGLHNHLQKGGDFDGIRNGIA